MGSFAFFFTTCTTCKGWKNEHKLIRITRDKDKIPDSILSNKVTIFASWGLIGRTPFKSLHVGSFKLINKLNLIAHKYSFSYLYSNFFLRVLQASEIHKIRFEEKYIHFLKVKKTQNKHVLHAYVSYRVMDLCAIKSQKTDI